MSSQDKPLIDLVTQQLGELDAIVKQTAVDLNTVRGTERVRAWKKQTVALLDQHGHPTASQQLSAITPGPSFTNDLFEEFTDEVEAYRTVLASYSKRTPSGA